jgi:hypothetical protein
MCFYLQQLYARNLLADDNEIRHASSINIGARSLNTYHV